ncbi:hypothetical protein Tco_0258085, partial [Tanacetum coccineum]
VIEKDNTKVKPAIEKEKPADVTSKVSKGKELDVLKYKYKIEEESNALDNPNESDKGPVVPIAKANADVVKAPVA